MWVKVNNFLPPFLWRCQASTSKKQKAPSLVSLIFPSLNIPLMNFICKNSDTQQVHFFILSVIYLSLYIHLGIKNCCARHWCRFAQGMFWRSHPSHSPSCLCILLSLRNWGALRHVFQCLTTLGLLIHFTHFYRTMSRMVVFQLKYIFFNLSQFWDNCTESDSKTGFYRQK